MDIKMRNQFHSLRTILVSLVFALLFGTSISLAQANNSEIDANKAVPIGFKVAAKQVLEAMNKWARAWAQLDARTYISSYSPNYIGKGFPSHFTWAASRQHRLENQKSINLSLTDVELYSTKRDHFSISFTQHYSSDTYKDVTRKQLDFKQIDNIWYIIAEKTLPNQEKVK